MFATFVQFLFWNVIYHHTGKGVDRDLWSKNQTESQKKDSCDGLGCLYINKLINNSIFSK